MKSIRLFLVLLFSMLLTQISFAEDLEKTQSSLLNERPPSFLKISGASILISADAASCGVGQKTTTVACPECGAGFKKTRAFSQCKQSTDAHGAPCGGIGCEPCTCTPN